MDRGSSHVHCDSLDEGGAQLCPCGLATPTPQQFRRGLPNRLPTRSLSGSSPPAEARRVRTAPGPHPPGSSRFTLQGTFTRAGSSRTPLRHAGRTHAIWQCWRVPALSRLLPPIPAPPGIRLPQLHRPCCDKSGGEGLSPPLIESSAPRGAWGSVRGRRGKSLVSLLDELRILAELPGLLPVRRQPERAPDPRHRRLRHTQLGGQGPGRPMRGIGRRRLQRPSDHRLDLLIRHRAGAPGPRLVQ